MARSANAQSCVALISSTTMSYPGRDKDWFGWAGAPITAFIHAPVPATTRGSAFVRTCRGPSPRTQHRQDSISIECANWSVSLQSACCNLVPDDAPFSLPIKAERPPICANPNPHILCQRLLGASNCMPDSATHMAISSRGVPPRAVSFHTVQPRRMTPTIRHSARAALDLVHWLEGWRGKKEVTDNWEGWPRSPEAVPLTTTLKRQAQSCKVGTIPFSSFIINQGCFTDTAFASPSAEVDRSVQVAPPAWDETISTPTTQHRRRPSAELQGNCRGGRGTDHPPTAPVNQMGARRVDDAVGCRNGPCLGKEWCDQSGVLGATCRRSAASSKVARDITRAVASLPIYITQMGSGRR
ncbi:hypothetical protein QBC34DRAFT_153461 [Podospora aff. communis PSN243]|uniref:Uncharacterized protein n=1 Tax=Podospora aff. communis PSN243 TaxID=3040156 RepID=A0AAV9GDX2_9PEZI|nr:hypothetical protein QBC34DRAFT_153461 [Podospora aff. communis PSN243]